MTDKIVVLSTSGSEEEARRIARRLVEKRVAACVNIVPGAVSVYQWQGKIEESAEWILVIKSSRELFDRLRADLEAAHSYQIPEVIALAVVDGSLGYLGWMNRELSS